MHVEDVILKVYFITKNINVNPREENKCSDHNIMVLLYDDHLGDTIISGNPDLGHILDTYWSTHW